MDVPKCFVRKCPHAATFTNGRPLCTDHARSTKAPIHALYTEAPALCRAVARTLGEHHG